MKKIIHTRHKYVSPGSRYNAFGMLRSVCKWIEDPESVVGKSTVRNRGPRG